MLMKFPFLGEVGGGGEENLNLLHHKYFDFQS